MVRRVGGARIHLSKEGSMSRILDQLMACMSEEAQAEWKKDRWLGRTGNMKSFTAHVRSEYAEHGPVSVVKIDAYCNVVSGPPKAEPKPEKKHSLTQEAYEYIREKAEKRHPFGMYLGVNPTDIVKAMCLTTSEKEVKPLTLDEVKLLVHEDGKDLDVCKACGKEHQRVAAVQLRVPNLEDADVRMDLVAKGEKFFGEIDEDIKKAYGRLAPFVRTFEHTDGRTYPVIAGNIVPIPDGDGGWEKASFCGPLYWHDRENGRIFPNNSSCVVKAAQGAEDMGWGKARSFSMESADLVIERRTANHQKSERDRATRDQAKAKVKANLEELFQSRGSFRRRTGGR